MPDRSDGTTSRPLRKHENGLRYRFGARLIAGVAWHCSSSEFRHLDRVTGPLQKGDRCEPDRRLSSR